MIRILGLLTELRTRMKLGLRNSQKQEIRPRQGFRVVPHLPAPLSASPHTTLLHYRKLMLTADNSQAFFLTPFPDVLMGDSLSQLYLLVPRPRNSEKGFTGQWAASCYRIATRAVPCGQKRKKKVESFEQSSSRVYTTWGKEHL